MSIRFYVGRTVKGVGAGVVFKADQTPTKAAYPQFASCVGPFRTKRAAILLASFAGNNNPHVRCVADAERISKSKES
jgi:hypothetical protein